jgi:ABC-type dipeptide/oligopeptide/nickel transport system ATPase component
VGHDASSARMYLRSAPNVHLSGLAIMITVLGFNFLGDGAIRLKSEAQGVGRWWSLSKERLATFFTPTRNRKGARRVSFSIDEGEILGSWGDGSVVNLVDGHLDTGLISSPPGRIVRGRILFNGREMLSMSERQMRSIRGREFAMIFQDPASSLTPPPPSSGGDSGGEAIWAHLRPPSDGLLKAQSYLASVNSPPIAATSRYHHQILGRHKQAS